MLRLEVLDRGDPEGAILASQALLERLLDGCSGRRRADPQPPRARLGLPHRTLTNSPLTYPLGYMLDVTSEISDSSTSLPVGSLSRRDTMARVTPQPRLSTRRSTSGPSAPLRRPATAASPQSLAMGSQGGSP